MSAAPGPVRCGVLGSPIGHSLSPALHRAAYAELGLEGWSYQGYEVADDGLAAFVAGCDGSWRGLSLTMPLKVAALQLGEVDPLAALVGAANTLLFSAEGRSVYNTDVGGLVAALRRAGVVRLTSVNLLGAGATARSALVSAAQLGASSVTVLARDPAKAELLRPLTERLNLDLAVRLWQSNLPTADLTVSTVVAGAADARAEAVAASAPVIFDAIYDPWPTPLAVAAQRAGRTVVNGLDLVVAQAVLQIELMTGGRVAHELLLNAGRSELAARLQGGQRAGAVIPG